MVRRFATVAVAGALLLVPSAALADGQVSEGSSTERGKKGEPEVKWQPGVKAARKYAKGRLGGVGFAVVDLQGRMEKFNGGRKFYMASTFKAMMMPAYLRRNAVEDRNLTGAEQSLLGPMIRASNNETTTALRNITGAAAINRMAKKAGMRSFRQHPAWGLSQTTPRDQARFMQNYESFIPDRHQRYARRLLASVIPSQRWGIPRARPTGWDVFFKGGWGVRGVNHQVGFLDRNRCRVALAIYTEANPSHAYGTQTLQGVANRLFRGLGTKRVRQGCG